MNCYYCPTWIRIRCSETRQRKTLRRIRLFASVLPNPTYTSYSRSFMACDSPFSITLLLNYSPCSFPAHPHRLVHLPLRVSRGLTYFGFDFTRLEHILPLCSNPLPTFFCPRSSHKHVVLHTATIHSVLPGLAPLCHTSRHPLHWYSPLDVLGETETAHLDYGRGRNAGG